MPEDEDVVTEIGTTEHELNHRNNCRECGRSIREDEELCSRCANE